MRGLTTIRLLYVDYYPSVELQTPNGKNIQKTLHANYTTSNIVLKSGKIPTKVVENMRVN